jgi:pyruvate ferredoxin oxidoreductase delta subunit
MPKLMGWRDLPIGGVIEEAGNASELNTGAWRAFRPVVDKNKCTNCLQCWIFCPDMSVKVEAQKMVGFDLYHCKGCGICANVCPVDAIEMKTEAEAARAEKEESK